MVCDVKEKHQGVLVRLCVCVCVCVRVRVGGGVHYCTCMCESGDVDAAKREG